MNMDLINAHEDDDFVIRRCPAISNGIAQRHILLVVEQYLILESAVGHDGHVLAQDVGITHMLDVVYIVYGLCGVPLVEPKSEEGASLAFLLSHLGNQVVERTTVYLSVRAVSNYGCAQPALTKTTTPGACFNCEAGERARHV